jgi:NAD(P)-dependent dehydrogenase (short-subunit alcohol dehydrogenase family)
MVNEMTNGKVAVVTGGLSGIGKGAVMELAKREYTTIIFDVQDQKADDVITEANKLGGKTYYHHCDLFSTEEIRASFQYVKDTFGKLDCAYNNAGFGILPKSFEEVTEAEIDKELGILVKCHMICTIEEIKMMKENGFGRIVYTASGAGLVGSKGMALYNACKHAIVGLTKGVALDMAKENITVNAIAPGTIETELIAKYKDSEPDTYAQWCQSNPSGRLGKPWEIGRVVAFLFEEDSSFINGDIIPVDSGFCAGK